MYFDRKHRDVQYEVGDQVMRVHRVLSSAPQGICAGFTAPVSGPYTVCKKLGTNVYELIDEEGDIVPRVPNDELKPAFLDEQQDPITGEIENQKETETEQLTPENEQISPGSEEENTDQAITDTEPRIASEVGRGKLGQQLKRTVSSKFDKRAKAAPTLNDLKIPEPVLVFKRKRGRPLKEPKQVPVEVSPRRTRAQKAQLALMQNS